MADKAKIGIIGAGLMGHGIAQVFALAGHDVKVTDPSAEALATLNDRIRRNLEDLGEDTSAAERVTPCADLSEAVADADVVFEAALENLELKQKLFAEIEAAAPQDALLASNTSVIPITAIMSGLKNKARSMGTHWWNPPFLVPLVEIIHTEATDPKPAQMMFDLLAAVGKTPVDVMKDVPGFVGNRLQHALWREAVALADVVLDCTDNFPARFEINAACVRARRPLVSGAAIRFEGQLAVFDLRRGGPCYRCLYPDQGDAAETCEEAGILGPVVGTVGALQALAALKLMLGLDAQAGRLQTWDALRMQWRSHKMAADPECPVCGEPHV